MTGNRPSAVSEKTPLGYPSSPTCISPPSGTRVWISIEASSNALELATAECALV